MIRNGIFRVKSFLFYFSIFVAALISGFVLNHCGLVLAPYIITIEITNTNSITKTNDGITLLDYIVPNIIHFIWFADTVKDLNFVNYISMLSAYRTQKPDHLMLHCDILPNGTWWERAWREIPFTIKKLNRPSKIFDQTIWHIYHQSDVARLEILIKYGGIYLDFDVILVNNLNPLRHYNVTLGKERGDKLNFGIIIASPNAMYLSILRNSYRNNYRGIDWDYNSARVPYRIYEMMPQLVHVEEKKLTTPDWLNREDLWERSIEWRELYSIHIMGHMDWVEHTPETIKKSKCTFGEVMRYFYYGTSDVITT